MKQLAWLVLSLVLTAGCGAGGESAGGPESPVEPDVREALEVATILREAERIPNSTGWFEILRLPNDVYAFWEPGHFEKVNAFLIIGAERDVLYDTGMGIASLGVALADLRAAEQLEPRELMVINSHNHLDHNGGNADFDEAWIIEDEWAIRKLTEGIPADPEGAFVSYWAELDPSAGIAPPADFDPTSFSIPPFPRDGIRFLRDGDVVDLGNRSFQVIHTTSHSPDGLALYDPEAKILFGGDTFVGDSFLIRDLGLLEEDLLRVSDLEVEWQYSSHGPQLLGAWRGPIQLAAIRRMIAGERTESTTDFAGQTFPLFELEGIAVTLAGDFLTY